MAGFLDSLLGGLGSAAQGVGNFFTGGGNGQAFGTQGNGGFNLPNIIGQGAGALGKMFGGGGGGGGYQQSPQGGGGGGFGNSMGGQMSSQFGKSGGSNFNFGNMFNNPLLKGLGGVFGSQLIGNPKPPALPQSFYNFQNQANAGGPPISQQSNQYLQTLMSGQNTAANDAATHSLDLNYQEQLRQLQGMYKSLRPGTDPTSDTTYQRDLSNLNDQYTRQRAQVLAQQQMGAAQQGQQAGAEQANQQAMGVETQVNQIAQQWNMDAQQRAALRNMLMEMSGVQLGLPTINSLFGGLGKTSNQ